MTPKEKATYTILEMKKRKIKKEQEIRSYKMAHFNKIKMN
jgi:hypothetical protein